MRKHYPGSRTLPTGSGPLLPPKIPTPRLYPLRNPEDPAWTPGPFLTNSKLLLPLPTDPRVPHVDLTPAPDPSRYPPQHTGDPDWTQASSHWFLTHPTAMYMMGPNLSYQAGSLDHMPLTPGSGYIPQAATAPGTPVIPRDLARMPDPYRHPPRHPGNLAWTPGPFLFNLEPSHRLWTPPITATALREADPFRPPLPPEGDTALTLGLFQLALDSSRGCGPLPQLWTPPTRPPPPVDLAQTPVPFSWVQTPPAGSRALPLAATNPRVPGTDPKPLSTGSRPPPLPRGSLWTQDDQTRTPAPVPPAVDPYRHSPRHPSRHCRGVKRTRPKQQAHSWDPAQNQKPTRRLQNPPATHRGTKGTLPRHQALSHSLWTPPATSHDTKGMQPGHQAHFVGLRYFLPPSLLWHHNQALRVPDTDPKPLPAGYIPSPRVPGPDPRSLLAVSRPLLLPLADLRGPSLDLRLSATSSGPLPPPTAAPRLQTHPLATCGHEGIQPRPQAHSCRFWTPLMALDLYLQTPQHPEDQAQNPGSFPLPLDPSCHQSQYPEALTQTLHPFQPSPDLFLATCGHEGPSLDPRPIPSGSGHLLPALDPYFPPQQHPEDLARTPGPFLLALYTSRHLLQPPGDQAHTQGPFPLALDPSH
ncbi:uncharacterized protein LOC135228940 [Loxodonta africana]|uniref:uncharacterized protein LOC135228940 n=1 Tax=Loxodonta africana TaxID=9785 RepID=UPI0030CC3BE0